MSSHHIVREKQEPALLILGLNSFDLELLGQLLEWSPTVIATSHVAEQLATMGIKVDRILGNDIGDVLQSDVKYVPLHDMPAAEAALNALIAENYAAVNIIADNFDVNDYTHFLPRINLVILHQHKKTYPISSGFTKWLPAGDLITITVPPVDFVCSGLARKEAGQYVTTADGVIKLEFADSFLFISETI